VSKVLFKRDIFGGMALSVNEKRHEREREREREMNSPSNLSPFLVTVEENAFHVSDVCQR
jgi:hypothetical protein